jgi:hypothetical protein
MHPEQIRDILKEQDEDLKMLIETLSNENSDLSLMLNYHYRKIAFQNIIDRIKDRAQRICAL